MVLAQSRIFCIKKDSRFPESPNLGTLPIVIGFVAQIDDRTAHEPFE